MDRKELKSNYWSCWSPILLQKARTFWTWPLRYPLWEWTILHVLRAALREAEPPEIKPGASIKKQERSCWTLATSSLRSYFFFNLPISESYFIIPASPEQATPSLIRVGSLTKLRKRPRFAFLIIMLCFLWTFLEYLKGLCRFLSFPFLICPHSMR